MSEIVASGRAKELAEQLESVTDELASFIQTLDSEEWARRGENSPDWHLGEDEKRSVACIAYHIASVLALPHTLLVEDAAHGKPLDLVRAWTVEGVAEWNAGVAEEQAGVTKAEVLALLRTNADAALRLVRSLNDEQLERGIAQADRDALRPWVVGEVNTVAHLVSEQLIGHVQLHRSSLRATVGR